MTNAQFLVLLVCTNALDLTRVNIGLLPVDKPDLHVPFKTGKTASAVKKQMLMSKRSFVQPAKQNGAPPVGAAPVAQDKPVVKKASYPFHKN